MAAPFVHPSRPTISNAHLGVLRSDVCVVVDVLAAVSGSQAPVAFTCNDADVRGQFRPLHGGGACRCKRWRASWPARLVRALSAMAVSLRQICMN